MVRERSDRRSARSERKTRSSDKAGKTITGLSAGDQAGRGDSGKPEPRDSELSEREGRYLEEELLRGQQKEVHRDQKQDNGMSTESERN